MRAFEGIRYADSLEALQGALEGKPRLDEGVENLETVVQFMNRVGNVRA